MTSTDKYLIFETFLLDSISNAVYDAMEEMGLGASDASELIEDCMPEVWRTAVFAGLRNYQNKLKMSGGKPKPRTI